eukprot:SAG11_NODE_421_length_9620_cov_10.014809_5_plen_48_part_00
MVVVDHCFQIDFDSADSLAKGNNHTVPAHCVQAVVGCLLYHEWYYGG